MLKEKFIVDVDAIFMYKNNFLIKEKSQIKDGTSYCNYHFRQALLGNVNDFTGKTKPLIEAIMFKNTGRKNFQHISNLKREVKKSKLPIEVLVGESTPFEVIIHDKSILKDEKDNGMSQQKSDVGYLPTRIDAESAMKELGGVDIEQSSILDRIETNCKTKGLALKSGWRESTARNLDDWAKEA